MLYMKTVLLGRCPTPPPPTTRTWWQTERGNTTTSSQPRTVEVLVAREAVHTTSQTSRRGTLRSLSRRLLHSPCTLSSLYSPLHSLYSPLHPDWCTFSLYKRWSVACRNPSDWTAITICLHNAYEYLKGFVNISYTCCSVFTVKEIRYSLCTLPLLEHAKTA